MLKHIFKSLPNLHLKSFKKPYNVFINKLTLHRTIQLIFLSTDRVKILALSVLYTYSLGIVLCEIRWGGPYMNIEKYQESIETILKKLEEDLPKAERLELLQDLKELLSAFFV